MQTTTTVSPTLMLVVMLLYQMVVFQNCFLYTALENGLLPEGFRLVGDDAFQSHLIISIARFHYIPQTLVVGFAFNFTIKIV